MKNIIIKITVLVAGMLAAVQASAVDYVIEGRINGLDGVKFYVHDYDTRCNIDSAVVRDGKLRFEGSYGHKALVRVESAGMFSNCILDTLAILDFDNWCPSGGTELNMRLRNFMQKSHALKEKRFELSRKLDAGKISTENKNKAIHKLYEKQRSDYLKLCKEVIYNNDNALAYNALMTLSEAVKLSPEEMDEIFDNMYPGLKSTRLVQDLYARIHNEVKTAAGKPFVDFEAMHPDGSEARFSDYVGCGKWVLVQFWTPFFDSCRHEGRKVLVPLYEKYCHRDDFEILGVGVMTPPEYNLRSLAAYGYRWPNILESGTRLMSLYGFEIAPLTLLISPEGIIVERDIHGDELVNAVEKALKVN